MQQSSRIKMKVAVDSQTTTTMLDYWLAKYALNGTFLGYTQLEARIFLCPIDSIVDIAGMRSIGVNYHIECEFDLNELLNATEPIFYELFLRDTAGTNGSALVDVPTRIINYDQTTDKTQYKYVRRFFVYDNICKNRVTDLTKEYVRWLYKATLRTELKTDRQEEIYVPTLTLEYHERSVDTIMKTSSMATSTFDSIYFMDISSMVLGSMITLIIVTIFAGVVAAYRIYKWWLLNPSTPELNRVNTSLVSS